MNFEIDKLFNKSELIPAIVQRYGRGADARLYE